MHAKSKRDRSGNFHPLTTRGGAVDKIFRFCLLAAILLIPLSSRTNHSGESNREALEYKRQEMIWVDSVYQRMTDEERIGQIFMIRAHSDKDKAYHRMVENQVRKYRPGGLIFFQGTPEKQVELTNRYQDASPIPLLIAVDAEWGLGMRFKEDGMSFPRAQMLGAIENDKLIYDMGREIGRQLKRIGVHINFAPVVDINNNPDNPVINDRSFGEDRLNVARKGYLYMLGLQDEGVLACAKHFPGHGDTDIDSHLDLPRINHDMSRLRNLELFPFRLLIQHNVAAIMTAHLYVPALEEGEPVPSSLSGNTVGRLLKDEMGYRGLVITDGMEMGGITNYYPPGEAAVAAFRAGNDIILLPDDLDEAYRAIRESVAAGEISPERLEHSVRKILRAKFRAGLHSPEKIEAKNVRKDLFTLEAKALYEQLVEESLTLVANRQKLIPIRGTDKKVASLSIGSNRLSPLQEQMTSYADVTTFSRSWGIPDKAYLSDTLTSCDLVIAGLHDLSKSSDKGFGMDPGDLEWLERLQQKVPVVIVLFGSPYALSRLGAFEHILVAYEESPRIEALAAQALFGVFSLSGKLPVSGSDQFRAGTGLRTASLFRLGYTIPERVGMDSDSLERIQELAEELIERKAAPGCQVLVAKDGRVVYHRSFGYHTYRRLQPVENHHLYDLASLTKVLVTTACIMHLADRDEISVFRPIGEYLPELEGTNKEDLIIEDILTHNARLQPWIPFYRETLTEQSKPRPSRVWYRDKPDQNYSIPVTDHLYMHHWYLDSIWSKIIHSELRRRSGYRYSDLGFYLLARLVEKVSGQSLDAYADEHIFRPLGLRRTGYRPKERFNLSEITPSEKDEYFRYETVHGYVHDMGAAMLGGVSGHAGLFSNAEEVAVLMQLLLNGGYYGGVRLYSPTTVALFTARPKVTTRRGLGFDMKQLDPYEKPNMSKLASYRTFGHLGFTGTAAWADPTHNLVFVFLSNRTYPSMENNLLGEEDYRPRIQSVAYRSLALPAAGQAEIQDDKQAQ